MLSLQATGITAEAKTYAEFAAVSADGTVLLLLLDQPLLQFSAVVTTTDLTALKTSYQFKCRYNWNYC